MNGFSYEVNSIDKIIKLLDNLKEENNQKTKEDAKLKVLKIKNMISNMNYSNIEINNINNEINKILESEEDTLIKLDNIISTLNKSDNYYKLINIPPYLDGVIKEYEINNNIDSIYKIIPLLKSINCETNVKIEKTLNIIYQKLFEIIKLEYKNFNSFSVLETLKDIKESSYYLNKCINNELNNLESSNVELPLTNKLKSLISEQKLMGSDNGIINEEIIKYIVDINRFDELKTNYTKVLNEIKSKEEDFNHDLNYSNYSLYSLQIYNNKFLESLKKLKEYKKKKNTRIEMLITSLTLSISLGLGIPIVSNSLSNKTNALTTTEIYIEGEEKRDPITNYTPINEKEVTKTLELIYPTEFDTSWCYYYNPYEIYDLSNVKLDTIEEYANLDTSFYNLEPYETGKYEINEDKKVYQNKELIKKCTITTQDFNDTMVLRDEKTYKTLLIILYVLLSLSTFLPYLLINNIIYLFKNRNKCKESEKEYKEYLDKYNEVRNYYDNLIENNSEFREKYVKIKENIVDYELENLVNEINNLIEKNDEVIKKYKKIRNS